jgi:hypothetical protein
MPVGREAVRCGFKSIATINIKQQQNFKIKTSQQQQQQIYKIHVLPQECNEKP